MPDRIAFKTARGLRDHQQITFVMLNRFCLSSQTPHSPLFLMNIIKLDGIPTKIKWRIHALLTL